jgi:hypothetical protein
MNAGAAFTTGSNNVAIGDQAGAFIGAGTYNVYLGSNAQSWDEGSTNRIAIGKDAEANADNTAVIGGPALTTFVFGTTSGGTSALTSVIPVKTDVASLGSASKLWTAVYATNGAIQTSDGRVKTNLQEIPGGLTTLLKLQPKTYFKHKSTFVNGAVVLENEGAEEAGFVAQEVSTIIPTAVVKPEDETKALWGMRYEQILPYTVKAVQELKAENDALKVENADIKAENADMKARLAKIEKALGL